MLNSINCGGSDLLRVRLGTSSGVITGSGSGNTAGSYESKSVKSGLNGSHSTTGFRITTISGAVSGHMIITKFDDSDYIQSHTAGSMESGGLYAYHGSGQLTGVNAPITQIQLDFDGGANFTNGSKINVLYEG